MKINKLTNDTSIQELVRSIAEEINSKLPEDYMSYIRTRPFYPLLKADMFDMYSKQLKATANSLVIAGTMDDSARNLKFHDATLKDIEPFIQYLIEDAIDRAYHRKVGEPEYKNLKALFKPFDNQNFRSFYHKIVYLRSSYLTNLCKAMNLESNENTDGILAYGYIDATAGLSFKLICCAGFDDYGQIVLSKENREECTTIRYDSIKSAEFLDMMETNVDLSDYNSLIELVFEVYDTRNKNLEMLRAFDFLDSSRYPGYPDDVKVLLYKENIPSEWIWVRCRDINNADRLLLGELLNEPYGPFGVHKGNIIGFRYVEEESGEQYCVSIIDNY